MRQKVSEPTNGSFMILKASIESGSSSLELRSISASVFGSMPLMAGTSTGLGRKSTTASRSGCTPLFLKAEPQRIGKNVTLVVPLRISLRSVSASG